MRLLYGKGFDLLSIPLRSGKFIIYFILVHGFSTDWYFVSSLSQYNFKNFVVSSINDHEDSNDHHGGVRQVIAMKHLLFNLKSSHRPIAFQRIAQRHGQLLILAPEIYHGSFSSGYIGANATNFADHTWP